MKQTNSLQKSYDPYANGRWYRMFIESDGSKSTIIDSDFKYASIDSDFINIRDNLYLTNIIIKAHTITGNTSTIESTLYYRTLPQEVRTYFVLPIKSYDYCEVFIFGEEKND